MVKCNQGESLKVNKKGFTLLEVTLFLAISASLTIIAIAGLGPRLRNVRFTQSVRTVESAVSAEFASSVSGQNTRPDNFVCEKASNFGWYPKISTGSATTSGSSKDCVINGALVVFRETSMSFYSIVSLRESVGTPSACSNMSFEVIRDCFKARIARGTIPFTSSLAEPPEVRSVSYQNGVGAESSIRDDGKFLAFGSVQNPNGTDRYQFFHLDGADAGFGQPQLSATNSATSVAKPYVCLKLSGRSAKLSFSVDSTKPKVEFGECSV
jgi:Tfp pilus assembly protein FimT